MRHKDIPVGYLRVQIDGQRVVSERVVSERVVSVDTVKAPSAEDVRPHEVISIDLDEMSQVMGLEAARLRERQPDDYGRVTRHRYVNHNAWVLAGTRIPTSAIFDFSEAGYTTEEIIREYPALRPVDVTAAIGHERQLRERIAA